MKQKVTVPARSWLSELYLWACDRLYYEFAWLYDAVSWLVSAGHWRRWQSIAWRYVRGKRVLEIGCGTGAMIMLGEQMDFSVCGVDRSPAMLAVAYRRLSQTNMHSRLTLGDGRKLPFIDASFDSVIATFPAGYILEVTTLSEIKRVLSHDGRFVIVGLWVEANLGFAAELIPVFYGHPRDETLRAIAERVSSAGFAGEWLEEREGSFSIGVLVGEKVA